MISQSYESLSEKNTLWINNSHYICSKNKESLGYGLRRVKCQVFVTRAETKKCVCLQKFFPSSGRDKPRLLLQGFLEEGKEK